MENRNLLNDEAMAQLAAMLEQDAANPAPPEEGPEMEEAASPDEVDTLNENVSGISEGDGVPADGEAIPNPDPQASAEAAAQTPALPDGAQSVEQLIEMYNMLKAGSADIGALREMNAQLMSIAEAMGYGQGLDSVELSADDNDPNSAARAEVHKILGPLVEQQQKHIRQKLIDMAHKRFADEHADAADMMDEIREMLEADEGLRGSETGMEAAYHLIRSKRYKPESAMLEDEAFIEKAAKNPKIYDRVVEDYLKKVAKGGAEAVRGIGSAGSIASSGRKKEPMTMQEANAAFARMLRE